MLKSTIEKAAVLAVVLVTILWGAGALAEDGAESGEAEGTGVSYAAEYRMPSLPWEGDETETKPSVPQRRVFWVEFFDIFGESLDFEWVNEGDRLKEPERIPEVEGLKFEYWYDYQQFVDNPGKTPMAYKFDAPVVKELFLCPYYTQLKDPAQVTEDEAGDEHAELVSQLPAVEEAVEDLINQILGHLQADSGPAATEPKDAAPEDTAPEETGPSGAEPADVESIPMDMGAIKDLIGKVLINSAPEDGGQPGQEEAEPQLPADEEMVLSLLQQLVGKEPEDAGPAPSVVVTYELEGDVIELEPGALITIRAELTDVPEGAEPTFTWWSNAGGAYEWLGESGESVTVAAEDQTVGCEYYVEVSVAEGLVVKGSVWVPEMAEGSVAAEPEATEAEPCRDVVVLCHMDEVVRIGGIFTLEASLSGFEDVEYTLRWQCDAGDGWTDFECGNELTQYIVADTENIRYNWRVLVTVADDAELMMDEDG